MIETIIAGAIGAAAFGFTTYLKHREDEFFDWKKFAPTVIIGGAIGAVAAVTGVDTNVVTDAAWVGFATLVVQNVWTWAMNTFPKFKKFVKKW